MKVSFGFQADIPEEMVESLKRQFLMEAVVTADSVSVEGVTAVRDQNHPGSWTVTDSAGRRSGFAWMDDPQQALSYLTGYFSQSPKPIEGRQAMSILSRSDVHIEQCEIKFIP
ncbi:MAG: hypothetical protein IT558_04150 [Alphaproteobacteria bacterium]|nr:hypothetical protein [Alphaproteobacteria bacterium]